MPIVIDGTNGITGVTAISSGTANTPVLHKDNAGNTLSCWAWVCFNGTTGAIRAAFNVASITRGGVGTYTVNFSAALPDANYFAAHGMGDSNTSSADDMRRNGTPTTTAYSFKLGSGATLADADYIGLAFFR